MFALRALFSDLILRPVEGYDLIGDVHGCAETLARLLEKLGYSKQLGVYQHPRRIAIFLGDIIDRGPRVREALHLVHDMVMRRSAMIVIGNHEFNAMTWARINENGEYLRPHTPRNTRQLEATLEQFANYSDEWQYFLRWFEEIPLFMEIPARDNFSAFRVVHACWDPRLIEHHQANYGDGHFDEAFICASVVPGNDAWYTRQRLTSGIDIPMPQGMSMVSSDGLRRSSFRTKFWATNPQTYGEVLFQPDPLPESLALTPISADHRLQMVHYDKHQPPLFIGHYWLKGKPEPITHNLACLDYSAVKYGRLVAYRMDGEARLSMDKFVWENVDP